MRLRSSKRFWGAREAKNSTQNASSKELMFKMSDQQIHVKGSFDMVREGGAFLLYSRLERKETVSTGTTEKHRQGDSGTAMVVGLPSPPPSTLAMQEICQMETWLRRLGRARASLEAIGGGVFCDRLRRRSVREGAVTETADSRLA